MATDRQAQVPVTSGKTRKCTVHPDKDITMSCDNCSDQLVCTKCVTTDHKTHTFSELEDLVDKKRVPLTEFVKSSGKQLNDLQMVMTSLQNLKQTVAKDSKTISDKIEQRMKNLQEQMNEIAVNVKEIYRSKTEQNMAVIEARIEYVTSLQTEITEVLNKCQTALASQSVWDIIEFLLDRDAVDEKCNNELARVPKIPKYKLSIDEVTSPSRLFGSLIEENDPDSKDDKGSPLPSRKNVSLVDIDLNLLKTGKYFSLPFGGINSICIVNQDEAWISYMAKNISLQTLHHVTRNGDILSTVEVESPVTCLRVSSDKSLLAACRDDKMRCVTPDGKITVLFELHGYVSGLCEIEKKRDIVVCLRDEGRIVKYSRKGKVLQSLSSGLNRPIKVSANKVTNEMVIIDKQDKQRKLIVIDSKMRILWEFDNLIGTPLEDPVLKFVPNQACYGKEGNIYVLVLTSEASFVVSIKNKLVQSFKRIGSVTPYSIDVEDRMWIGTDSGDVIVVSPEM